MAASAARFRRRRGGCVITDVARLHVNGRVGPLRATQHRLAAVDRSADSPGMVDLPLGGLYGLDGMARLRTWRGLGRVHRGLAAVTREACEEHYAAMPLRSRSRRLAAPWLHGGAWPMPPAPSPAPTPTGPASPSPCTPPATSSPRPPALSPAPTGQPATSAAACWPARCPRAAPARQTRHLQRQRPRPHHQPGHHHDRPHRPHRLDNQRHSTPGIGASAAGPRRRQRRRLDRYLWLDSGSTSRF